MKMRIELRKRIFLNFILVITLFGIPGGFVWSSPYQPVHPAGGSDAGQPRFALGVERAAGGVGKSPAGG